jgi:hypothetical protein
MIEEQVKDELSCCRVEDYGRLRIQGERDLCEAEELLHVFRTVGMRLTYF